MITVDASSSVNGANTCDLNLTEVTLTGPVSTTIPPFVSSIDGSVTITAANMSASGIVTFDVLTGEYKVADFDDIHVLIN